MLFGDVAQVGEAEHVVGVLGEVRCGQRLGERVCGVISAGHALRVAPAFAHVFARGCLESVQVLRSVGHL